MMAKGYDSFEGDGHTRVIDEGYKEILEQVGAIEGEPEVVVGFFAGNNPQGSDGTSIAEYMFYNEYGTEDIPARPLQGDTADARAEEMFNFIANGLSDIAQGDSTIEKLLTQVGIKYKGILQDAQIDWEEPPNAEETVEQKGEDNPLIEHGTAVNAIKFKTRM